jgi:hypothetical protein
MTSSTTIVSRESLEIPPNSIRETSHNSTYSEVVLRYNFFWQKSVGNYDLDTQTRQGETCLPHQFTLL